jgi:UDP-glucose 4-epimerase
MHILVTGGNGFIGKNIKESYLAQKYTITAPSRFELDCSDDESVATYFKKHSFDVVIHSAAKAGHRNASDTSNLFLTNSRMMFNLLKHQNSWGKLLNMGSGAIYGMQHYIPKMSESYFGTHIPKDEHGYNKYVFGSLVPYLNQVYDFRIFGIFGKYEDYAIRFISNAICKTIFDLPITLRQDRKFDYLYINDLMPVLEHFIHNDPVEKSFNITPDESVSLLDIARLIREISGKNIDIVVANEGLGMEYSGDNLRLRKEIKHLEFTPLKEAVSELYNWYLVNKAHLNKEALLIDK